MWTWTALDSDSKMILSWMVGDRNAETANFFMDDLAQRLANPNFTERAKPEAVEIAKLLKPEQFDAICDWESPTRLCVFEE